MSSVDTVRKGPERFLGVLLFLSGSSALLFEVIWFELLKQTIGSSTFSVAVLLMCFMGGLSIGSELAHRLDNRQTPPLLIYAALEIGVALSGLGIPVLLPHIRDAYALIATNDLPSHALRAVVVGGVLVIPTVLMGASLPIAARVFSNTDAGVASIGRIYSINIAGGVVGAATAGFWALPAMGLSRTSVFAAAVCLVAAALAVIRHRHPRFAAAPQSRPKARSHWATASKTPLALLAALSGFSALGCQIIWTRMLTTLFGPSVYAFSIVLAIFLTGLAIGAGLSARSKAIKESPAEWIVAGQLLAGLYAAISVWLINDVLSEWSLSPTVEQPIALRYVYDACRAMLVMFVPTAVWGATLPLLVRIAATNKEPLDVNIGRLYAINTVGAIAGVFMIGFLAVPMASLRQSMQIVVAAAFIASSIGLIGIINTPTARQRLKIVGLFVGALVTVMLIPAPNGKVMGFGHEYLLFKDWDEPIYSKDGAFATVAVSHDTESDDHFLHVGGKVVASSRPADMRLQYLLAAIPLMLHPAPKSVLVIGLGTGVTAGTFALDPTVERIVICEVEPEVIAAADRYFRQYNFNVLADPRVEIVLDDGRHYLQTSRETFDIISTDSIHPWVRGSAALHTVEFHELVRTHLNDDGFISQWIPLYQTNEATVKSQIFSASEVFKVMSLWRSDPGGSGYDLVTIASGSSGISQMRILDSRWESLPRLAAALAGTGLGSKQDLRGAYLGSAQDLRAWFSDAPINRDDNLALQYLAGLSIDAYSAHEILESISIHLRDHQ